LVCFAGTLLALLGASAQLNAQLPPDFPQLSIAPNTNPAPGCLFGSLTVSNVPGYSNYFAILDNAGNPILLNQTNSPGEAGLQWIIRLRGRNQRAGLAVGIKRLIVHVVPPTWPGTVTLPITMIFRCLPNGHALILIYDPQYMDLSKLVPGGYPAKRGC